MVKRKLLIIAGAGSTLSIGMPSMQDIHNNLNCWANDLVLHDSSQENLYSYFYKSIKEYWSHHSKSAPNFEDVLYAISLVGMTFPAGVLSSSLGAFVEQKKFPQIFYAGKIKSVDRNLLNDFAAHLTDKLLEDLRFRCIQAENIKNPDIVKFNNFFAALHEVFDIAVVSSNYDDLLYRALPEFETGFDFSDQGRFKPERIYRRKSWSCYLHVHGSVHFDIPGLHEIFWQDDLGKKFSQNASGRGSRVTTEGNFFPTSTIIAGYGKTQQVQQIPFRTYYSELDRLVDQCDALLFLGYGFGDTHINNAFAKFRVNPRPVVVIDFANDNDLNARSGNDCGSLTVKKIMGIFNNHPHEMESLGYSIPNNVRELKSCNEFERSANKERHLSIWYNGMNEASIYPGKIISELDNVYQKF